MAEFVEQGRQTLYDEIRALRLEITTLQEAMNELRAAVNAGYAKVIDLPNLRRAN